jgi:hypothetical protein
MGHSQSIAAHGVKAGDTGTVEAATQVLSGSSRRHGLARLLPLFRLQIHCRPHLSVGRFPLSLGKASGS